MPTQPTSSKSSPTTWHHSSLAGWWTCTQACLYLKDSYYQDIIISDQDMVEKPDPPSFDDITEGYTSTFKIQPHFRGGWIFLPSGFRIETCNTCTSIDCLSIKASLKLWDPGNILLSEVNISFVFLMLHFLCVFHHTTQYLKDILLTNDVYICCMSF